MPEAAVNINLSPADRRMLGKITWTHEVPHPDGGVVSQFGLHSISVPKSDGLELIRLKQDRVPEKVFVPRSPSITGGPGPEHQASRLIFDNLGLHSRISVFLQSANDVIHPLNPDRINEIGDFVVEVDKTFKQDGESRLVLEGQRNLLSLYEGYVLSGVLGKDDELAHKLIEEASVHMRLLAETRKQLPLRVRGLPVRSQQLGVSFIREKGYRGDLLVLDPELIEAVYTPESDDMTYGEFREHSRKILRYMPSARF